MNRRLERVIEAQKSLDLLKAAERGLQEAHSAMSLLSEETQRKFWADFLLPNAVHVREQEDTLKRLRLELELDEDL